MHSTLTRTSNVRKDDRIIIHIDYTAFYCAVVEHENPALRALPLAVQQKNIIVTCNYEARRRGLRKLQLISEAKKLCPDVVIVVGEQLDKFRDASKALYKYIEAFTWNKKVERLGFDEVFLDVTDIVDFNVALLNPNDLHRSFFQLSRHDPSLGFSFDATEIAGHVHPEIATESSLPRVDDRGVLTQLILGSHLAHHIRHKLEEEKGYSSSVGISTSKLLAKLVGSLHKPKGQTTLMPPYEDVLTTGQSVGTHREHQSTADKIYESNVTSFMDSHDVGKVPGIGFKTSHKIRNHVLTREAEFDEGLIYGGAKESVTVGDVRRYPGMSAELLEKLLGGPGAERGIGWKIWGLVNGIDDSEVKELKKVPSQISIEDSYVRLDTLSQVRKELCMLCTSLLRRMQIDLLEDDGDVYSPGSLNFSGMSKRWIAHPKTIRLTTRPRPAANPDGSRTRSFNRISRSSPLPNFVFDLREGIDAIVERLVQESLIPLFHRLHPEKQGWNLSLMNVGVTNMVEAASEDGCGGGRDIGRMFRRQTDLLKEWKVEDRGIPPGHMELETVHEPSLEGREPNANDEALGGGSEDALSLTQDTADEDMPWEVDEDIIDDRNRCSVCDAVMPAFAMAAHERFHALGDG
jgi:DNA polymerase iota